MGILVKYRVKITEQEGLNFITKPHFFNTKKEADRVHKFINDLHVSYPCTKGEVECVEVPMPKIYGNGEPTKWELDANPNHPYYKVEADPNVITKAGVLNISKPTFQVGQRVFDKLLNREDTVQKVLVSIDEKGMSVVYKMMNHTNWEPADMIGTIQG